MQAEVNQQDLDDGFARIVITLEQDDNVEFAPGDSITVGIWRNRTDRDYIELSGGDRWSGTPKPLQLSTEPVLNNNRGEFILQPVYVDYIPEGPVDIVLLDANGKMKAVAQGVGWYDIFLSSLDATDALKGEKPRYEEKRPEPAGTGLRSGAELEESAVEDPANSTKKEIQNNLAQEAETGSTSVDAEAATAQVNAAPVQTSVNRTQTAEKAIMQSQQLAARAKKLREIVSTAQEWVGRNEERVKSCGKSPEDVQAKLRQQGRILRRLERACGRKMCAGVFGPSQAGKSYLLSSLARDANKKVMAIFGNEQKDFLRDINPGGSKESTGLVTRFTMTPPPGIPDGFPVHVRLLSEPELVKIFANSYFSDCEHKGLVGNEEKEAIRRALNELKGRAQGSTVAPHLDRDAMEDLREYISGSFGGFARANALEDTFWQDAINLAPKLSVQDRARLFGLIWGEIPEFNEMFLSLAQDLEKLGNPEEAFCEIGALQPREASIIDVETLGKTDFKQFGAGPEIQMRTRDGRTASIARKNATAIIAELTLVMANQPAEYFDHTDLLDFPGYKARLECTDIADYLHKGKEDSAVEQFFRRGKVAYLFQRYNVERELTSLLLCVAGTDNIPGLPGAIEEWIISTHGRTPAERAAARTALFYVLTKADRLYENTGGAKMETRWNDVLKGYFLAHFAGTHSQATRWVDEWQPGRPFQNLFMLRNINMEWSSILDIAKNADGWTETGIRKEQQGYVDELRNSFVNSELPMRHFVNPGQSFDEILKLNDGGIEFIKSSLQPLCDPNLKLNQIAQSLTAVTQNIYSLLAPFYNSGNPEEELRKKMLFFANFGKLFKNPNFQERFPELLSNFKMRPDQLFYFYEDALKRYEDYKEEFNASIQQSIAESISSAEPQEVSDNPLDFLEEVFDEPQAGTGEGQNSASGRLDEYYFYADRIIEAWSSRMRDLAETDEYQKYYQYNQPLMMAMLDEFDQAVGRLDLRSSMVKKFREIAQPTDVPPESKIRKQAAYAIGLLNDFVSWMGKNPATVPSSQRRVDYNGKQVDVFASRPEVKDFPELSESFVPFSRQWYKDWLTTFYGVLKENVSYSGGNELNIEENAKLGKMIGELEAQGV